MRFTPEKADGVTAPQTVRSTMSNATDPTRARGKDASEAQPTTTRRGYLAAVAASPIGAASVLSSDTRVESTAPTRDDLILLLKATNKPFLTDIEAAQVLQVPPAVAQSKLEELRDGRVIERRAVEDVSSFKD